MSLAVLRGGKRCELIILVSVTKNLLLAAEIERETLGFLRGHVITFTDPRAQPLGQTTV